MEWYEILINIVSGLVVTIPLVIKLVEYVRKAIQEKNWNQLVTLVMNLMSFFNSVQFTANHFSWEALSSSQLLCNSKIYYF